MQLKKVVLSFIFSFTCLTLLAQAPKGKLFIIGGGSRSDAMVDRLVLESGLKEGGYVIILPMSSEDPDSAIYYAKEQFTKVGLTKVYGFNFKLNEPIDQKRTDSIRHAKLVYISGGDQSRFMGVVLGTDIEKAIHDAYTNGSVIAGTSAGAAVMSKVMITGNELKHTAYKETFKTIEQGNVEIKQGLGFLTTAIIDQHFLKRSRHNRLISAIIEYPDMMGIGIDESTAILVSGKHVEVVGDSQVIVLLNTKKSTLVRNGKLGARGIQMDVLLPGDTFELK